MEAFNCDLDISKMTEGNLNTKYYPEFGHFSTTFIGILLELLKISLAWNSGRFLKWPNSNGFFSNSSTL